MGSASPSVVVSASVAASPSSAPPVQSDDDDESLLGWGFSAAQRAGDREQQRLATLEQERQARRTRDDEEDEAAYARFRAGVQADHVEQSRPPPRVHVDAPEYVPSAAPSIDVRSLHYPALSSAPQPSVNQLPIFSGHGVNKPPVYGPRGVMTEHQAQFAKEFIVYSRKQALLCLSAARA
ncbi:hypothetical protein SDRG_17330 [Saprolegnia diclina VS20]|uniref:Uncharacterized protein n=1 Tax=Saprolegnia diclina (strain VS20) TaxID=1156394 RepID=T0QYE5_SAPDV|nr:hypothetical protein SDRG_17330 [Saprolegnia diclina VS20]EQC24778.1 hypothetical protein SDRG_17330 [Saprolegnia diclina VS20]|eukprot:XP_008621793.1 hypothetical protein SDRG_17330 [Saprolegnia diclina VS20]